MGLPKKFLIECITSDPQTIYKLDEDLTYAKEYALKFIWLYMRTFYLPYKEFEADLLINFLRTQELDFEPGYTDTEFLDPDYLEPLNSDSYNYVSAKLRKKIAEAESIFATAIFSINYIESAARLLRSISPAELKLLEEISPIGENEENNFMTLLTKII